MLSAVLEEKTKTDKTLQESVQKLGELNNLFMNSNLKEMLTEGLKQLEAEGWIKQEESITLMKLYT
jgi:DNA-binding HxlR family transcriptional regulator